MAKEETINVRGRITECMPNAMFKISLDGGHQILGIISGKIRRHNINILLGDQVEVEISPYDLTKGRITFRYK